MSLTPLELWAHWGAPNPWKVCMILEVLHLPYKLHLLEFSEVKQPTYLALTPNGRLPTLKDPNTNLTLWEVRSLAFLSHHSQAPNCPISSTPGQCH
jgi:glutathione S-transferase